MLLYRKKQNTGPPSESYIQPLLEAKDDFLQTHRVALPQTILNRINGMCKSSYTSLKSH
jgi:hypothetical protein